MIQLNFKMRQSYLLQYSIRMNKQMVAIQLMGMLMTRQSLQMGFAIELVQILNKSYFECQKVVTILQQIFAKQKSAKILLGVQILQFLVKNCNKNFHQAANKESFQSKVLALLKRVRGKSNFLKDIRSNSDNWNKIEAKALYLIQLWYDTFILEESVYNNIINTYKILRKENVMFPPRSSNQKNLIFVKTQSPILQNIEEIARMDQQKFGKKLKNMGMEQAFKKIEKFEEVQQKKKLTHRIDLDQMSQKIAIVRSNGYQGSDMIKLIQGIKKDLQFGKVDTSEQKYWKDIKQAAELLIQQWQEKNVQLIRQHQRKYLQMKMGRVSSQKEKQHKEIKPIVQQVIPHKQERKIEYVKPKEEINLLDL